MLCSTNGDIHPDFLNHQSQQDNPDLSAIPTISNALNTSAPLSTIIFATNIPALLSTTTIPAPLATTANTTTPAGSFLAAGSNYQWGNVDPSAREDQLAPNTIIAMATAREALPAAAAGVPR